MVPSSTLYPTGGSMSDMKSNGSRTRSTFGLAGFLLVLVAALGAQAEPPSSKLPGRTPDSKEPWGAFLGRAAHEAIGNEYVVQHPTRRVFLLTVNLYDIVAKGKLGDPERLSEGLVLILSNWLPAEGPGERGLRQGEGCPISL
jgi:hypothetical protein